MNNYFYKLISRVVDATSSKKLCDALRQCQYVLKTEFNGKTVFMEELQRATREKAKFYKHNTPVVMISERPSPNISIYGDKVSYLIYSSFKINNCTCIEELNNQISDIIDFFENKMTKPKTDILSIGEIIDMLDIVQKKFNLISAVTYNKELEVYILNKSHICYDSFLLTFKNTCTGSFLNKWMVFSLSPCLEVLECNKYYVFMHEIGHILYHAVVKDRNTIPEFFGEVAFLLGMRYLNDDKMLSEFFADVFSVSAVHNTCYSDYNPFKKVLSDKLIDFLELYFSMLTYKVNRDTYGISEGESVLH